LFPVVGGALKLDNKELSLWKEKLTSINVFQELYILFENKIIEAVYCHVISFN